MYECFIFHELLILIIISSCTAVDGYVTIATSCMHVMSLYRVTVLNTRTSHAWLVRIELCYGI